MKKFISINQSDVIEKVKMHQRDLAESKRTKATVLIADDEPDVLEILEYYLTRNNYFVIKAANGAEALHKLKNEIPDIAILDVMMPEMDGIEVLKKAKSIDYLQSVLIVMLTAAAGDNIEIEALENGADDFISKPIKPKIFISRIDSIYRKNIQRTSQDIENSYQYKNVCIDREMYICKNNDVEVDLPKKEFELLYLLLSKPNKVFRREEILEKVWGNEVLVGDRTIDVHIRRLRNKLGDSLIKTIAGVGYKLQ
jgi:two-component system alkaline phosphatase synthesis response regulator PhoP